jgi:hypothetical protein
MSIAPWWCGAIIATKSRSASPDGLISIAAIILFIATRFSAAAGVSEGLGNNKIAAATSPTTSAAEIRISCERSP